MYIIYNIYNCSIPHSYSSGDLVAGECPSMSDSVWTSPYRSQLDRV